MVANCSDDVPETTLTTVRLSLRPLGEPDLDRIHQVWTSPGVRRFRVLEELGFQLIRRGTHGKLETLFYELRPRTGRFPEALR